MAAFQFPHFEIFKGNSSMDTLTDGKYGGGGGGGGGDAVQSGGSLARRYSSLCRKRGAKRSSVAGPRVVETLSDARTAMLELMDNIEEKLERRCGWHVTELVQGGSLGMGTSAPTGHFDCSIVIYSTDITPSNMLDQKSHQVKLDKLNTFIQSDEILGQDYQHVTTYANSVKCTYAGVEVELTLCPHWSKLRDFYNFLESIRPQKQAGFFRCASKWQVQFLRQRMNQAKDYQGEYIRRALAWRNRLWSREGAKRGRPSTYLLSLLVVRAYEDARKKLGLFSSMSPETLAWQTTEEMKSLAQHHSTIDVYWEQYYSLRQYPTLVPPNTPRILDPSNPSNNLYLTGMGDESLSGSGAVVEEKTRDWEVFRRSIHTLNLSKQAQR